jgi:hypothetical protein
MGIPTGPAAQGTQYRPRQQNEQAPGDSNLDVRNSAERDPSTANTPPPLVADAQSPQSSSLPSTTNSTNGDGATAMRQNAIGEKMPPSGSGEVKVQSASS